MNSPNKSAQFLGVIQKNKGIIYKVANSYCHDAEDRKDLIQEIIIQLWLSFDKYDAQFALTTWIYRIALNVSISLYRKEIRRSQINQPLPQEIIYLHQESVLEEIDGHVNRLHHFIKELKEIERAIIILYLEEKSHQETADILGLSVKNISVRISRIKEQLRQKFSTIKS